MWFKKKEKIVDLVKGKKIFFEENGNGWSIVRERWDYSDCNVPKDVEEVWTREIMNRVLINIDEESNYNELVFLFSALGELRVSKDIVVNHIIKYFSCNTLDTFTTILLCEILKRKKKYAAEKCVDKIDKAVKYYKEIMINSPITVDESHLNAKHLATYDFSEKNIRLRIEEL